jgi:hypothetical protein
MTTAIPCKTIPETTVAGKPSLLLCYLQHITWHRCRQTVGHKFLLPQHHLANSVPNSLAIDYLMPGNRDSCRLIVVGKRDGKLDWQTRLANYLANSPWQKIWQSRVVLFARSIARCFARLSGKLAGNRLGAQAAFASSLPDNLAKQRGKTGP